MRIENINFRVNRIESIYAVSKDKRKNNSTKKSKENTNSNNKVKSKVKAINK